MPDPVPTPSAEAEPAQARPPAGGPPGDDRADDRADDRGAAWMRAWQRGDAAAFERIVEAYSGVVYALLTRFLGPREGRDDLVQEVFLRVLRARDRYNPTARFTTWLYRIVFNLAVNTTERTREHTSLEVAAPDAERQRLLLEVIDDSAPAPDAELARADLIAAVRAAIAALPENQRMALVLAKYHELPYTEIAEVLGSSEKAVKSLVHRARENLRAALIPVLEKEVA